MQRGRLEGRDGILTYFVRFRLRSEDVTPELEAVIRSYGPYGEGAGFCGAFYEVADVEKRHSDLEDELVRRGVPFDRVVENEDCEMVRYERRFRPAEGKDVEVAVLGGEAFVPVGRLRALLARAGDVRAALGKLLEAVEPVRALGDAGGA